MGRENEQRHNVYSQHGCIGCCVCEGGAQKVKRQAVLWTLGIFTCGLGLLVLPFYKKCVYCGHNMFMNQHKHGGE